MLRFSDKHIWDNKQKQVQRLTAFKQSDAVDFYE